MRRMIGERRSTHSAVLSLGSSPRRQTRLQPRVLRESLLRTEEPETRLRAVVLRRGVVGVVTCQP